MPPMNAVLAGSMLTLGLRSDFKDAYAQNAPENNALLGSVMDLNIPSGGLYEIYGYFESAPYPVRRPRGRGVSFGNFKSNQFTVYNHDFYRGIKWHKNDRMDDRTKSLPGQARQLGQHFSTLDERILFQMLQSTADTDLLPGTMLAPDGVAIYSLLDGAGAVRFGVTNGNLLTSTGVADPQQIVTDYYSCIQQFMLMQDTEGQPLWDPETIRKGCTIIHGAADTAVFERAFFQTTQKQAQMNVALAENVGAASVSNILQEAARSATLWGSPRITDHGWYVFLKGTPIKPVFRQNRMDIQEWFKTEDNAESPLDNGEEYMVWGCRRGYGIMLPYSTIHVHV